MNSETNLGKINTLTNYKRGLTKEEIKLQQEWLKKNIIKNCNQILKELKELDNETVKKSKKC